MNLTGVWWTEIKFRIWMYEFWVLWTKLNFKLPIYIFKRGIKQNKCFETPLPYPRSERWIFLWKWEILMLFLLLNFKARYYKLCFFSGDADCGRPIQGAVERPRHLQHARLLPGKQSEVVQRSSHHMLSNSIILTVKTVEFSFDSW